MVCLSSDGVAQVSHLRPEPPQLLPKQSSPGTSPIAKRLVAATQSFSLENDQL
jgi:hypothetical protein